jgi:outer membrane protein assembly factor BamB
MQKRMSLAAAIAMLALSAPLAADNWARFRGPNGSGIAADAGIPDTFSEQNGILWKVKLAGPGNSAPIIWYKNLFVHGTTADGKERQLICLDADSGKTRWTRSFPAAKGHTHQKNTQASATPCTDGQVVVNAFWNGKQVIIAAIDLEGKELWHHNLGGFKSQHGAGASPIIYQDKVFLANDQDGTSTQYAFNKFKGEIIWKADRDAYRACYSAPFILEKPGHVPELVVASTTSIRGYNLDTGSPNWTWKWKFTGKMPLRTTGSPIVAHDMLFACSGDGGGDRHMVAVKLNGNGTTPEPTLAWENKKDFPYVPSLLNRGDHLYFINDKGFAGCFEARSGKPVWFVRQPDATFCSSPLLIGKRMVAISEDGDVYIFAAEPRYRLLGKSALGETVRASPAVANGRLYIRGHQHLYCIGKPGGR